MLKLLTLLVLINLPEILVQFSSLSINALHIRLYIYIRQLSSFRAPTLWLIDLAIATCHIQYTFLSLCQLFLRENRQNTKIPEVCLFVCCENDCWRLLGAQSINTERTALRWLKYGSDHVRWKAVLFPYCSWKEYLVTSLVACWCSM